MTMQQLSYVLTIEREGSLNKAAQALYLSQPSLSNALRDLEQELGITIFERTSRGVTPTADGLEFLTRARALYQQYDILRDEYAKGKVRRKFSVSTQHYSFAVEAFISTMKQFGSKDYDFAILETKTRNVIDDVANARAEIGILYLSDFNRRILTRQFEQADLTFTPFVDCKAYAYLYKDHPLAGKKSVSIEDLSPYPCLMFSQGGEGSEYYAEEILSDLHYPRVIHTADRATNLNLMRGLNAFTLCSGILSRQLNGSEYVAVPFREDEQHQNTVMTIGYLTRTGSSLSDVGSVYVEELKKYVTNPDDTPEPDSHGE